MDYAVAHAGVNTRSDPSLTLQRLMTDNRHLDSDTDKVQYTTRLPS